MAMVLISCEPTTLGKKNVLINLAELGENIDGKSVEEIEQILSKKGYAKFYDWSYERGDYFNRTCVYSNGIELDSTCFERDMTSELSLLEDNACVLVVDYYKEKGQTWVELAACYILPNNPTKDYKTLSSNLYRYCSINYPFKASKEEPEEFAQGYMWEGDIETNSSAYLLYSNDDERCKFALQNGWITQEEYNDEITDYEVGFRKDFLEQLNQPYVEIEEDFEAASLTQDKFMYAYLVMLTKSDSFFEIDGIMTAECYWVGHEPELPIETQRRFAPRVRNISKKFQWFK
jgi:hypothetical protein